jgi:MFS family permease
MNLQLSANKNSKLFYGYKIVLAGFIIHMVMLGIFFTYGIFFEPVATEFGWSRAMFSGAHTVCQVVLGILAIAAGKFTDRFGPRMVMVVCAIFMGAGYLLMSQINSGWHLYLFFGVMVGIGMGGCLVPITSIIARWFVRRRGMMTGIVLSSFSVGSMIMPPLARWLISLYGWRTSYIILGIIALTVIIAAAQFLKRDPGKMGLSPDGDPEMKAENMELLTTSYSLSQTIRSRQFWMICVILLFNAFTSFTITVHIVIHATGLGVSTTSATNILPIFGAAGIASMVIVGGISDKIGYKFVYTTCFIVNSVAFLLLIFADQTWMLYLFAVIFGFGYGGTRAVMSPLVAHLFGLGSLGTILGGIHFSAAIGAAIGPLLAGRIFDVNSSYQPAWLICGTLMLICVILTLLLKTTTGKKVINDPGRSPRLY